MSHSGWLHEIVNPASMQRVIDPMLEQLKSLKPDFIAVRGISGAAIGGALQLVSRIPLVIVRKPNDGTHSCYSVEFDSYLIECSAQKNYVIVDDLISTGNTVDEIIKGIAREISGANCVAIYLYHSDRKQAYSLNDTTIPVVGFGDTF